jgi:Phospholipase_D-nuclease N-terminal
MTENSPPATPENAPENAPQPPAPRRRKREWKDLSPLARAGVVAGAAIQLGLLIAALVDLFRRRPDQIRGPRALWVAVSGVNFFGPIAYFVFGRRRN